MIFSDVNETPSESEDGVIPTVLHNTTLNWAKYLQQMLEPRSCRGGGEGAETVTATAAAVAAATVDVVPATEFERYSTLWEIRY